MIVTDPERRWAIGEAYRAGYETYRSLDGAYIGSVMPGMWSFMLAARLRGLGTCWTTIGLFEEERTAEAFGIDPLAVTIGAISPVAYTLGTEFKPAMRPDPDEVIHWDSW